MHHRRRSILARCEQKRRVRVCSHTGLNEDDPAPWDPDRPVPTHVAAQSLPNEIIGHRIRVPGDNVDGTTARLSEVERELVDALPPQQQAERLLQYALSHHVGATDEIKATRGMARRDHHHPAMATLMDVARNGADLRVRAAAIELELAAMNMAKTAGQVDALLAKIAAGGRTRAWRSTRWGYWAIAASRPIASTTSSARSRDPTKTGALPGLRGDRQSRHRRLGRRSGGGVSSRPVAECAHQRRRLRPCALRHADARAADAGHSGSARDGRRQALPAAIRIYGYRALREITDETLPDDPRRWRDGSRPKARRRWRSSAEPRSGRLIQDRGLLNAIVKTNEPSLAFGLATVMLTGLSIPATAAAPTAVTLALVRWP